MHEYHIEALINWAIYLRADSKEEALQKGLAELARRGITTDQVQQQTATRSIPKE